MVILGKKFGRMGNRLWIFAYFAANAIEHQYPLLYRNFDEYIRYFDATRKNRFAGYPIKARLSRWLLIDFVAYLLMQMVISIANKTMPGASFFLRIKKEGEGLDLNNPQYLQRARNQLVIVRDGGLFYRDNRHLLKHKEVLKTFFQPRQGYLDNISRNFEAHWQAEKTLIGVHLRKYDYRRIRDGRLFLDDQKYQTYMQQLAGLLNNNTQFMLCSDEPLNLELFSGLDVFTGTGHLIEDLYAFARCDYLMGPPSSYTMWASFYGDVPLLMLYQDTSIMNLRQFEVIDKINKLTDVFYK